MLRGASYSQAHRWLQVKLQRSISYTTVCKMFEAYKKERFTRRTYKALKTKYKSKQDMFDKAVSDWHAHGNTVEVTDGPEETDGD